MARLRGNGTDNSALARPGRASGVWKPTSRGVFTVVAARVGRAVLARMGWPLRIQPPERSRPGASGVGDRAAIMTAVAAALTRLDVAL